MWLNKQVSLYNTYADNNGQACSYREILLSFFDRDLPTILKLRKLSKDAADYKQNKLALKSKLQCYTPAALLETKATGKVKEIHRTGVMQLDFDHADIKQYDIEELKQAIFELPFIGFCGLSCSGDGFYALALIAEPEKLTQYAEHCFETLLRYGIKADTSKGKKVENLRYLSYDANMLIRENPEPLFIKHFPKKPVAKVYTPTKLYAGNKANNSTLVNAELNKILNVQEGSRWATVQHVAYTLGGLCDMRLLSDIENAINSNGAFSGEETKYLKCANDVFKAGSLKPI